MNSYELMNSNRLFWRWTIPASAQIYIAHVQEQKKRQRMLNKNSTEGNTSKTHWDLEKNLKEAGEKRFVAKKEKYIYSDCMGIQIELKEHGF